MLFSPKQAKPPWSIKDSLSIIYRRAMNKTLIIDSDGHANTHENGNVAMDVKQQVTAP